MEMLRNEFFFSSGILRVHLPMAQSRFFGFLRGLPEEQIGADGGAEYRDDHEQLITIEIDARKQRCARDLAPWNLHAECSGDIEQQYQSQKLQITSVAMVGNEHLRNQARDAEQDRERKRGASCDQAKSLAHRCKIGCDIDGIGHEQRCYEQIESRRRQHPCDIIGKPVPRIPANAGTDDLNSRHERQGQEHRPEQREAKLCTCLRISGDAARVVVGGAGHEPRPERPPDSA